MKERTQATQEGVKSTIIHENTEAREFSHLVKAWTENKISYKTLLRSVPSYSLSVPQRILRHLFDKSL